MGTNATHSAAETNWGFGAPRAQLKGFSYQEPVRGLVRTARLTAKRYDVAGASSARAASGHDSNDSSAARSFVPNEVLRWSTRVREEAAIALRACEATLAQLFKAEEDRLRAKALLLPLTRVCVRLDDALGQFESAASAAHETLVERWQDESSTLRGRLHVGSAAMSIEVHELELTRHEAQHALAERSAEAALLRTHVARCQIDRALLISELSMCEGTSDEAATSLTGLNSSVTGLLARVSVLKEELASERVRREVELSKERARSAAELGRLAADKKAAEAKWRDEESRLKSENKHQRKRVEDLNRQIAALKEEHVNAKRDYARSVMNAKQEKEKLKVELGDKLVSQHGDLKAARDELEQARKETREHKERKREVVAREMSLARRLNEVDDKSSKVDVRVDDRFGASMLPARTVHEEVEKSGQNIHLTAREPGIRFQIIASVYL
jgi:chromosome segregation ATPase